MGASRARPSIRLVRRHGRLAVGAALAGLVAPAVLVAILAGRAGRTRGLRLWRRWQRSVRAELAKWR